MLADIDLGEIPEASGDPLFVNEHDIQKPVVDSSARGELHPASGIRAIGGNDAQKGVLDGLAILYLHRHNLLPVAGRRRDCSQREPPEPSHPFAMLQNSLDHYGSNALLALVDEEALPLSSIVLAVGDSSKIHGPKLFAAHIGDLVFQSWRHGETPSHILSSPAANDAQLAGRIDHPPVQEETVDNLLNGAITPNGDDELRTSLDGRTRRRRRIERAPGNAERVCALQSAADLSNDSLLLPAGPAGGGGRIDNNKRLKRAHLHRVQELQSSRNQQDLSANLEILEETCKDRFDPEPEGAVVCIPTKGAVVIFDPIVLEFLQS